MTKRLVVCLDCGDTLVDEATQVFAPNGDVLQAQAIPGALDALHTLHARGYRLALVADGRVASFENILKGLRVWDLFEAHIISQAVGAEKPSERMFHAAMQALCLTPEDADHMVMIGNNIKRDIAGANAMGMHSILLTYSPRYCMTPACKQETPEYRTESPACCPELIEQIERSL